MFWLYFSHQFLFNVFVIEATCLTYKSTAVSSSMSHSFSCPCTVFVCKLGSLGNVVSLTLSFSWKPAQSFLCSVSVLCVCSHTGLCVRVCMYDEWGAFTQQCVLMAADVCVHLSVSSRMRPQVKVHEVWPLEHLALLIVSGAFYWLIMFADVSLTPDNHTHTQYRIFNVLVYVKY